MDVILNCNRLAMHNLRAENYQGALSLLTRAADLLSTADVPVRLQAITFNNLGCFYKRTGRLSLALQYLQKALVLEATSASDRTNLAGTHLNVCAIQSTLGCHDVAITHAYAALELLKNAEETANAAETLAIAYHNAGVEEEHLKNYEKAAEMYGRGWKVACRQLGPNHSLTASLKTSYHVVAETRPKIGVRYVKDMRLPSLPRKKGRSLDASYHRHNSRSGVSSRESTPDRVQPEPFRSHPGVPKHRRVLSGQPRVRRFKKLEEKTLSKRQSTLAVWKTLKDAAVTIQRHWRGFRARQDLKAQHTQPANTAVLEDFKQEAKSQPLLNEVEVSITSVCAAFARRISRYKRPNSRSFNKPLSPIPECCGEEREGRLKSIQAISLEC
jgi:hypothetical protein